MADRTDKSVEAIFRLYELYGCEDYIGEPVSQTEHMVQCAMLAEAEGCSTEIVLGALFHDVGHLLGMDQQLPRMKTGGVGLGVQNHDDIGAEFLKGHGLPEITCQMVKGHVNAKRYLVYKDSAYHNDLSDASKMTLIHQGGPMTEEEAQSFEALPAFDGIIKMRKWDENAKDPTIQIEKLEKYKHICKDLLTELESQ